MGLHQLSVVARQFQISKRHNTGSQKTEERQSKMAQQEKNNVHLKFLITRKQLSAPLRHTLQVGVIIL